MNVWRAVVREVVAAGRSLRYDLRRPTAVLPPVPDHPGRYPEYDAYARLARRGRTAVAVAVLAIGGAAATYFGVVGGLTALLADHTAGPAALPGPSITHTPDGPSASRGLASRPASAAPPPATIHPAAPGRTAGTKPLDPRPPRPPPRPTATRPAPVPTPAPDPVPTCGCPTPSPTATSSPSPSPTPSPSQAGSPPPAPSPPGWADAS